MLIGLISDTHIPKRSGKIPEKVFEAFNDVDLILHAGDLVSSEVIDELKNIAPTYAVRGNMDPPTIEDLPPFRVLEIEGINVGITHGVVYPKGDIDKLYYIAKELDVKILINGHTHRPKIETMNDILFVNPGSPTNPRLSDPTVMLMKIEDGNVDIEAIKVGKPTCAALNFKPPENKTRW